METGVIIIIFRVISLEVFSKGNLVGVLLNGYNGLKKVLLQKNPEMKLNFLGIKDQ